MPIVKPLPFFGVSDLIEIVYDLALLEWSECNNNLLCGTLSPQLFKGLNWDLILYITLCQHRNWS